MAITTPAGQKGSKGGSSTEPEKDSTKEQKNSYETLSPSDEPLIFHHGGKLMRDYLNEADIDKNDQDYEYRALFKTIFTNAVFTRVFKDARNRKYAVNEYWVQSCIKIGVPVKYIGRPYQSTTARNLIAVNEVERGLLTLYAMEGSPSDLRNCGERRLTKLLDAIQEHPAFTYVCRALLDLANISCEGVESKYLSRSQKIGTKVAKTKQEKELERADKASDALIDSVERAIFEGDMEWLTTQYENAVKDSSRRVDDEGRKKFGINEYTTYWDKDGIHHRRLRCPSCGGFHTY